jgi:SAM-dependent MidA family methyltransferase
MREDPLAFPGAWNQSAGLAKPLFGLYREAGLAAVAVELNLQVDELAPEVAEAIERGAAALFLGGYSPYSTLTRQSAEVGKEARQRKTPRAIRNQGKAIFKSPKEQRRSAIAAA